MSLCGSITAIITPMKTNGDIDLEKFIELIKWQIAAGSNGLVICGSTGESATLTHNEKMTVLKTAYDVANNQISLIAGTGTHSTQQTINLTQEAHQMGYQYSLLTCPYFNKPTQRGLFLHYQAIADAIPGMQHILYSIPSRSVIRIENNTVSQLALISNIIGIKDSGSSVERVRQIRASCGPDFKIFSSDDEFALALIKNGGNGAINVTANVVPQAMQRLVHLALEKNWQEAEALNEKLQPLFKALFCQSNPIPVKALLAHLGKIAAGIRLPLTWLDQEFEEALYQAYDAVNA